MRILGIDPGTVNMGYGVIDSEEDEVTPVDYGALSSPQRSPIGERLSYLYRELVEIISRHQPDAVAVEQPFVARNARSALAIGRAQAVAMLAAQNAAGALVLEQHGIPIRDRQRLDAAIRQGLASVMGQLGTWGLLASPAGG